MQDTRLRSRPMNTYRSLVWLAWAHVVVACSIAESAEQVTAFGASVLRPTASVDDTSVIEAEANSDLREQRKLQRLIKDENAFDDSPRVPTDARLLIGVKSAVIQGFASRQLLRQTWADPARLPDGVTVVFLGCEPTSSAFNSSDDELRWREALKVEKATYKDLLTSELGCYDSYFTLVDKVKGFFRWTADAVARGPLQLLALVMVVDDDVYVRVDELLKSLEPTINATTSPERYYAGEVLSIQLRQDLGIGRDPSDKNAVPYAEYPMKHKPPFASGAHYVLSLDLVQFVARNDRFLKGVGTLEDVSVAYWLLALLQIKPSHVMEFDNVRYTLCHNSLIAYADVTPAAIRQMDANIRSNHSLCHGFSFTQWDKRDFQPEFPRALNSDPYHVHHQLTYYWDTFFNTTTRELVVVTTVLAAETNDSVSAVYLPAKIGFAFFCEPLIDKIHREMPRIMLPVDFCEDFNEKLRVMLVESARGTPEMAHLYTLPISNLKHGTSSALILVRLTMRMMQWMSLIEGMMAAMFPDAFVSIEGEKAYATWLKDYPPDIVFAKVEDLEEGLASTVDSTTPDATKKRPSRLPSQTRLVILESGSEPTRLPIAASSSHYHGAVLVSSISYEPHHPRQRHLFLPAASSSFAHRIHHSPRNLLTPTLKHDMRSRDSIAVGFCDCDEGSITKTSRGRREFVSALESLAIPCASQYRATDQAHRAAFVHDADVDRCRQYKFAVVFEDNADSPGFIGPHIVSAFLAGSIPIYYGHSPTVSWLFNPKALVDCRVFASLSECATHVARIHASADLYAAMRNEPPVVNHTAFKEAFSWHPDAIPHEAASSAFSSSYTVGRRFRDILLAV